MGVPDELSNARSEAECLRCVSVFAFYSFVLRSSSGIAIIRLVCHERFDAMNPRRESP